MPGGVSSPVRAFGAVGGTPPFIARGAGSRLWDVDGRQYVDLVGSWGPLILGHAHEEVLAAAREQHGMVLPSGNADEAALTGRANARVADTLLEVCAFLRGESELPSAEQAADLPEPEAGDIMMVADLADVRGQAQARRALEVAAAGAHNLLMSGPPGSGKSMLAQRLPGILPLLGEDEALEAAAIASIGGRGIDARRWRIPPYRQPHHTASGVALVGGGSHPRPGEISLAHRGVLFLDELPEWDRRVLEVLREPLESGHITISRAARQAEFPARFQLVAAMNPCPCGWAGDPSGRCHCSAEQIARYRGRISGPLLDRIDLQINVPRAAAAELRPDAPRGEASAEVRARVCAARRVQIGRAGKPNAQLGQAETERDCRLSDNDQALLERAIERLQLSARAAQRILRVARSIADLDGTAAIGSAHLAEAIGYLTGLSVREVLTTMLEVTGVDVVPEEAPRRPARRWRFAPRQATTGGAHSTL